jgi:hypothetical protein
LLVIGIGHRPLHVTEQKNFPDGPFPVGAPPLT